MAFTFTLASCDTLLQVIDAATETGGITQSEAASGLKNALEIGVTNGTSFLGKKDGFLKNAA